MLESLVFATPGDRRGNQGGATEAHYSDVIPLLGGNVTVSSVLSHNIDMRDGYPHSTTESRKLSTGRPPGQHRRCHMACFVPGPDSRHSRDRVHQDKRIIIKRKYVVEAKLLSLPSGRARTVSIQEDVRDVVLTRYGGDLEMNLNLFLRPDDAASELKPNSTPKKPSLSALVDIGYDTLVREGTNIIAPSCGRTQRTAAPVPICKALKSSRPLSESISAQFSVHVQSSLIR